MIHGIPMFCICNVLIVQIILIIIKKKIKKSYEISFIANYCSYNNCSNLWIKTFFNKISRWRLTIFNSSHVPPRDKFKYLANYSSEFHSPFSKMQHDMFCIN